MSKVHLESRTLHHRSGTYGPAHDPYGYEEFTVCVNGVAHTLHTGLSVSYSVDGKTVAEHDEKKVYETFEQGTGMTPNQVEKYYWRLHPYFEDPMGPASRYI